jgi:hypothetical protein
MAACHPEQTIAMYASMRRRPTFASVGVSPHFKVCVHPSRQLLAVAI